VDQEFADFFGDGSEAIKRYVDILLDRGIAWGLIGPREGDRLWERHVLNSVAGAALIPERSTVVDVGSGAGLPGIPLAVLRPDLMVTLLDPLERRSAFLELVVGELGLGERVRVVRGRAEEHREQYQAVVSRAVAPLPKLLGWCAPLRSEHGSVLALKGVSATAELGEAGTTLKKLGLVGRVHELAVPVAGGVTWVVEAGGR
jgi:16S rRNA (guanine527-N7)-methyltransferase